MGFLMDKLGPNCLYIGSLDLFYPYHLPYTKLSFCWIYRSFLDFTVIVQASTRFTVVCFAANSLQYCTVLRGQVRLRIAKRGKIGRGPEFGWELQPRCDFTPASGTSSAPDLNGIREGN